MANEKIHRYRTQVVWTGNLGQGTASYRAYERSHEIVVEEKPLIAGSSDPAFRGDKTKYNPEELFVASLSICHMLWYLHLCAEASTEVSPTFLCHHCIRTFLFSDLLGQRDGLKCDRELLYLGAVMHDLGLTERFDGEQRFEVDGADAARAFVLEHGLSDEKAEVVWDAIALHTSIGIVSRKQPEMALVHLGASADVLDRLLPVRVER
jgi:hypothetical protein